MGRGLAPILLGLANRGDPRSSIFAAVSLLLVPFVVVLIALTWRIASDLRFQIESARWPPVPGVIEKSGTRESWNSNSQRSVVPDVLYSFEINGKRHESGRIAFFGMIDAEGSDARRTVNRFPLGKVVDVFVHPNDDSQSVLVNGILPGVFAWTGLLIGMWAIALGGVVLVALWYQRSTRSNWVCGYLVEDIGVTTVAKAPRQLRTVSAGVFCCCWGLFMGSGIVCFSIPEVRGLVYQALGAAVLCVIGAGISWAFERRKRDLRIDWSRQTVEFPEVRGDHTSGSVSLSDVSAIGRVRIESRTAEGVSRYFLPEVNIVGGTSLTFGSPMSGEECDHYCKWLAAVLAVPVRPWVIETPCGEGAC